MAEGAGGEEAVVVRGDELEAALVDGLAEHGVAGGAPAVDGDMGAAGVDVDVAAVGLVGMTGDEALGCGGVAAGEASGDCGGTGAANGAWSR